MQRVLLYLALTLDYSATRRMLRILVEVKGGGGFTPLDVCCGFWWRLKEEDPLLR